jgi:hypothetical protein
MILMRSGMNIVRLNQSGIPPQKRFSFYDQIHTTGMDIHQCIDARAALTLGKDMTFRDYAQGSFRMRGIGKGQTVELFIIPEVMRLIDDQMQKLSKQQAVAVTQQAPPPAAAGYGTEDLLSLQVNTPTSAPLMPATGGRRLLVNVAAWLTVNGMRSENMQFRMLCEQSIDNVSRKRAYHTLTKHYRELTQLAFSERVKEFGLQNKKSQAAANQDDGTVGFEEWLRGSKRLFEDDFEAIKSVVLPKAAGAPDIPPVGIEKIQKIIDIMSERLDYTVQNSIPITVPLSDTLRNSVIQRKDFIQAEYDKAVVDKILMVLVNSETLVKSRFGEPSVEEASEEDQDANLQKEQVSEEEVLKEQVSVSKCYVQLCVFEV